MQSVAKIVLGRLVVFSQVFDHPGDAIEGYNSDKDNEDNYDGIRSWATEVDRTEKVELEINVGNILVDMEMEIGMRWQKLPIWILRDIKSDKDNVKNSDVLTLSSWTG